MSAPSQVTEKSSWQALVCGSSHLDPPLNAFLMRTGLIHIFVVSGTQLILLEQIFIFLKIPFPFRMVGLLFYAFCCNLQLPVTRAFLSLIFSHTNQTLGLAWRSDSLVFASGVGILALFPESGGSLSLYLSWLAALGLTFPHQTSFPKALLIYFLLLGPLWGFANLHPITILFNFILAPLIGFILFPLALSLLPFPGISPFFDVFLSLLRKWALLMDDSWVYTGGTPLPRWVLWFYLLGLHGVFHFYQLHSLRRVQHDE